MVYKHAYLNTLLLLHTTFYAQNPLKGDVGGHALNSHGNNIVHHGKSWSCVFEFLWESYYFMINVCHHSARIVMQSSWLLDRVF